jgi:hypothetical protein
MSRSFYSHRILRFPLLAAALIATIIGCSKGSSGSDNSNLDPTEPAPAPSLLSGEWDMYVMDLVSRDGTVSCFTPTAIRVRVTQSGPTVTGTTGAGTLSCTIGNVQVPPGNIVDGRLDGTQLRFSLTGLGANARLTGSVYGTPPSSLEGTVSTSYNLGGAIVAFDGGFQATKR